MYVSVSVATCMIVGGVNWVQVTPKICLLKNLSCTQTCTGYTILVSIVYIISCSCGQVYQMDCMKEHQNACEKSITTVAWENNQPNPTSSGQWQGIGAVNWSKMEPTHPDSSVELFIIWDGGLKVPVCWTIIMTKRKEGALTLDLPWHVVIIIASSSEYRALIFSQWITVCSLIIVIPSCLFVSFWLHASFSYYYTDPLVFLIHSDI